MNRLKEKYQNEIVKKLREEFDIKNLLAVPKLEKIVVNSGVGSAIKDKSVLEKTQKDLTQITGQKPSVRLSKVSVASFGMRKGQPVGLKVTLRDDRMYSFFDRLVTIVLPRLRDFRGVSLKSFDKEGNYSLGLREHTVFPEVDLAKSTPHGMEITIVTNTKSRDKAQKLLELLGMPFEKKEE